MRIDMWPVSRLQPYAANPRINDKAIAKVARSLTDFGFRQPIVVDREGVVIVGHTRLLAAKSLGMPEVPVHVADLTEDQARQYRIADNATSEFAEWDWEKLAAELEVIGKGGEEALAATALSAADLENVLRAEFTPAIKTPLPSREHHHTVSFTDEQWETVNRAIEAVRAADPTVTTQGAALERICGRQ